MEYWTFSSCASAGAAASGRTPRTPHKASVKRSDRGTAAARRRDALAWARRLGSLMDLLLVVIVWGQPCDGDGRSHPRQHRETLTIDGSLCFVSRARTPCGGASNVRCQDCEGYKIGRASCRDRVKVHGA